MVGKSRSASELLRDLGQTLRVHARVIAPLSIVVVLGSLLAVVLLALYAQLVATAGLSALAPLATSPESSTAVTVVIMLPILLIGLLFALVWGGVVVEQASARISARRVALGGSAWRALRVAPRAALVGLIAVLAVVLAVVLTPLAVLVGLLGLAATPVVRRTRPDARWPRVRTLVVAAIPLGAAAWMLARVALALPSVWLTGSGRGGVRAAFVDGAERSRGREAMLVAIVLVGGLITVGVSQGLSALAAALPLAEWGPVVAQLLAVVLVGPLLLVGLTVQYCAAGSVAPPPRAERRVWRARTAVTAAASLVVTLLVPGAPAPATAVGMTPTQLVIAIDSQQLLPDIPLDISAGVPTTLQISAMRAGSAEGSQPSGTVTVSVDGTPLTGPFSLSGNPPTVWLDHTFGAGSHEITVTYAGDSTFAAASATGTVSAGVNASVTLAAPGASATYGVPSSFTATVSASGTPTGTVEFVATPTGGGETVIGTVAVTAGSASLDTATLLAPGTYGLVARYSGDDTHSAAESSSVTFTVGSAATSTSFTVSPPGPSAAGTPLVAHVAVSSGATPTAPRGTIEIMLSSGGSALATGTLVNGSVDIDFALPPGMQAIRAWFRPDAGFEGSYDELTYTVSPYTSTVVVTATPASAVFGQDAEISATVTAATTATGSVSFVARPVSGPDIEVGSGTLDSGTARVTVSTLEVGTYELVATYSGSAGVSGATSAAVPFTVARSGVDVAVTSSLTSPTTGDTTRLTIDVTAATPGAGIPRGAIEVRRDGVVVGSGTLGFSGSLQLDVAVGGAGSRTFSVTYAGDDQFASGSGSLDLTVARASSTTILFGALYRSAVYGDLQTWEGSVSSDVGPPTGTVELWVGGGKVAEAELDAGRFTITTDDIPVGSTLSRYAWVVYGGDSDHEPSDSLDDVVSLELARATVDPEFTYSPQPPAIGGTATLRLDLGTIGAGPTGTVTFSTTDETFDPVAVVDGVAELEIDIDQLTTWVEASYSGDTNVTAWQSDPLRIDADRELATVTLTASGPFTYGTTVDLIATVALGGGSTPDHGVRFSTSSFTIADDVEVIGGVARLAVCVGDTAVCPTGPRLGVGDTALTARYLESSVNQEGISDPLPYSVLRAATTTTLTLNTSSTVPGSAVTMTATVATATPGVVPTGAIAFSARMPGPDGPALATFEAVPLVDGTATLTVVVGTGLDDLRWPADAVIAQYIPGGTLFSSSTDTKAFSISRIGVSIGLFAFASTAFSPTNVQVTLTHAGGSSAPFRGTVTVTSDTGQTCVVRFPDERSCPLTWSTVGTHRFSATYSGDLIYAPSGPTPDFVLAIGKATSSFAAGVDSAVVTGTDVAVRWNVFDPASTGTVSVWGDGAVWCTAVPLSAGECTGRFGAASATGLPVEVRVQYTGDGTWLPAEQVLTTRVTGCATLDVRSTELARGTVTVDTAPNCGSGGYLVGTRVTVTAHPVAPNLFTAWRAYGSSGLEIVSRETTTSFVVGADSTTWVHVASFEQPCYPITASATGYGGIVVVPGTNCTSSAGVPGYVLGTAVDVYPRASENPNTGEPDVFAFFGTLAGATVGPDRFGDLRMAFTVTRPTVVPVTFGPNCREVSVTFEPAATAGSSNVVTAPNCFSPAGDGFHPGTPVTVTADSGNPRQAIASWRVGTTLRPDLGAGPRVTVVVDRDDLVLTATLVGCATLTVTLDSGLDSKDKPIGSVDAVPSTNCPDGSSRYVDGTAVTLTPRVLAPDTVFRGWDGERLNWRPDASTGPVSRATRTVVVTDDLTVVAGFYLASVCSPLTILGDPGIVEFGVTGCGPGAYFDIQKQQAQRQGVEQWNLWQRVYRSTLRATVSPSVPLDVYISVRGDTSECFGGPSARGPATDRSATSSFGPLTSTGSRTCEIGGPITVVVQACQTLDSSPRLHLSGDISGATFGAADLPSSLYAPGPDGTIGTFDMAGFDWVQGVPIGIVGGQVELQSQRSGPCRDAGNAFPADTPLALFATSPSPGITFVGFGDAPPAEQTMNPILTTTTATARTLRVTADYVVTCHTLGLGEGITVIDGARCPGTDPSQNSFIHGTAVKVQAAAQLPDGRWTEAFRSGIVGGQIGSDSGGNLFGFVYMDSDKSVTADYPTKSQRVGRGIVQGLKIVSGVAAIAAPIILGWFFPPAGALFAYLGAAAGIANLIPGGREVGAIFELIDPTNITECAARWAFGNTGNPTGGPNVGAMISTANTLRKIYQAKDVLEPAGAVGLAAGAASFGYGLYSAGIGNTDLGPQTLEELAGTSTMTGCLDQQWQAAGSNLSGR